MSNNVKVVYRLDSNVYKILEKQLGVNYKSVPKDQHESAYRCGVNDVLTALRNGFMEE
ncbi:hypothetical protein [Proteus mirabilis]|uniref:hypothetical protein n=1 Tax=Proteus mirabilis TaxID=584 RepID=UPI0034D77C86